jgi:hypothetical protein
MPRSNNMPRSNWVHALLTAALVACAGCGDAGNNVWVKGKLLKGGTAYVPPKDQVVTVTFVGLEIQDNSGKPIQAAEPFQAEVDQESGIFSVPGTEGRGIPPGKYRVAVTQKLMREAYNAANPKKPKRGVNRETDLLANRFGLDTSPIIREVKSSGDWTIDLDHPAE